MISHLATFAKNPLARAVGAIFVGQGFLFGTWTALIPHVKSKFGLDEAQLGLLLLSLPAGVLLANPISVPVLRRLGVARSTWGALAASAFCFVLPIAAPSVWATALGLFAAGTTFSVTNIAMNTCASQLESGLNLRVMSTCHGLWSSGAMSGSALAGTATALGVTPILYVCAVCVGELLLCRGLAGRLREVPEQESDPDSAGSAGFAWPNAALWTIITISICTNLTEGTMADWSAVFMREVLFAPEVLVGWGFASYAFFMAAGRFLGDGLLARYSRRQVLQVGGFLAAFGLILPVLIRHTAAALFGFACVGAGVSLGAPILYAAASQTPGMAKGAGLATMNTFAMVGFLGGPAFIGFLAKMFSLPMAFAAVATVVLVWIFGSRRL